MADDYVVVVRQKNGEVQAPIVFQKQDDALSYLKTLVPSDRHPGLQRGFDVVNFARGLYAKSGEKMTFEYFHRIKALHEAVTMSPDDLSELVAKPETKLLEPTIDPAILYEDINFEGSWRPITTTPVLNLKWIGFNDKASSAYVWGTLFLGQHSFFRGTKLVLISVIGTDRWKIDDFTKYNFNDRSSSAVCV